MKRLLLITLDFPPRRGGVARYLSGLSSYFNERMAVVHGEDQLLTPFVWPHWLKSFLPVLKNRGRFDVLVVSHIIPLGTVAYLTRLFLRKPYIVILHGMDFALAKRNRWKSVLTRRILKSAELVATNTENLAREVKGFAPVKNIEIVYPSLGKQLVEKIQASGEPNKQQGTLTLITVARLVPRKGHQYVLDALAILRERELLNGVRYEIIGDGPTYRDLYHHAKQLGLGGTVVFVRNASDDELIRHYGSADIFVMPTEHLGKDIEGFGTVYIEAGAFGLPVIGSELPGIDEAILHEETGLLVPPSSPQLLANALERLICEPELRGKLGEAGQKRAWTEFMPQNQFSKFEKYL